MSTVTITNGKRYPLENVKTHETATFRVLEVGEYRGKHIVFGEVEQHGIVIYRGVRAVKRRPGCLCFLGNEPAQEVKSLVDRLRGNPLVFVIENSIGVGLISGRRAIPNYAHRIPILNSGPLYGDPALEAGWPAHKDKPSMMRKAARLIDVWYYWSINEHRLPEWCKTTSPAKLIMPSGTNGY